MHLIRFFHANIVLFFLSASFIMSSAQEENPFYEHVRRTLESGIFCGTYARAMEEVDLQLELLKSGHPQEFRQAHNITLSSCSLQLLYIMKELGDYEAAEYITSLEKNNMKIIYVIYRRYYGLVNEINDRQYQNKGIGHRFMPRKLQQYWSEVFRQNIELNVDLDFFDTEPYSSMNDEVC